MFGAGLVVMGIVLLLAFFVATIYNIFHRITNGDT
jgi:hypothetical protein